MVGKETASIRGGRMHFTDTSRMAVIEQTKRIFLPISGCSPHACRNALLLLAHGVRVDRCRGKLGVAQPLLHHVERDTPADGLHPEAMPQALGAGVGAAGDACRCNDLLHPPEGCHAAPGPEQRFGLAAPLRLTDAVYEVERVQQLGRHRYSAVYALAALLQALEHDN